MFVYLNWSSTKYCSLESFGLAVSVTPVLYYTNWASMTAPKQFKTEKYSNPTIKLQIFIQGIQVQQKGMLWIWDIVYSKQNNFVWPQKGEYYMCLYLSVPVQERKGIVSEAMKITSASSLLQKPSLQHVGQLSHKILMSCTKSRWHE